MSMLKQLRAFYAFVALRWLRLSGALWILYLLHVGWSLWQVGVAEGVFHAVSFATQIPTGLFADRVGRCRSLQLGLLFGVLSPPLEYLLAPHGLVAGSAAMGLGSLGWSFIGGADQALLHDLSRRLPGGPNLFARLYGRMDAIALLSGALAAPVGGYLAVACGWAFPFFGQALLTAGAFVPVLMLPGATRRFPGPADDGVPPVGPPPGLRAAWSVLRGRPGLFPLVLFGAMLGIVATSNHLYGQSTLTAKGASILAATSVIGLSSLFAAGASAGAHLLAGRRRGSLMRVGAIAFGLLIAALGSARGLAAPLAYTAADSVEGGVDVLYVTELNHVVPENLRATLASAPDFLFSLGMIVLFPLEGWAMGRVGLATVYAGLGFLLALFTLFLWRVRAIAPAADPWQRPD